MNFGVTDLDARDQYVLPPNSVVFAGCVGDDQLAEQLRVANKREGVLDVYKVKKGQKTGACAVLITGHHRFHWAVYSLIGFQLIFRLQGLW